MAIKFFGDESYLEHVVGVSGYVAPVKNWEVCEKAWLYTLEKYDHKRNGEIVPFHMTDFESRYGIYADTEKWGAEKRIAFLGELIDIINVTVGVPGFGIGVRLPLNILPSELHKNRVPLYMSCFVKVLEMLAKIQEQADNPLAAIVLDRTEELSGKVLEVIRIIEKENPEIHGKLPPLLFDNKEKVIPLQVADLWAYESAKEAQRKSDTPRGAGGLMSWAASKAVVLESRRRAKARLG